MSARGTEIADEPEIQPAPDDVAPGDVAPDDAPSTGAGRAARSRRPMVAGGLAGLWGFVVGVGLVTCLVMLAWAVSPNSAGDAAAAWRAAGLTWLGAHLVPLQVGGEPVTLLPIGGLLLGLLLVRRSGAWAGRLLPEPAVGEVAWLVLGAGLLYGVGGAAVAWLSAGESASAQPGPAGLVTGAVAAVGALWGISREARLAERTRAWLSDAAWRTGMAGLAAVVGLFAAGSVLVTASLVRHFAEVGGTLSDLDPGVVGAAGVTLVDALSLPNLAIWALAVIVGPGFQMGSTGALSAFGGEVESLPALPVLAAIPTTAPWWAPALLLVPVLLGVLAGRIRWGRDLPTASGALIGALGLAAVTAPLTAAMLRLSTGSLGGDRLAQVGPVLAPVTLAATGLIVLGFLLEAAFQSLRLSWDLHRAERRASSGQPPGVVADAAIPTDQLAGGPVAIDATIDTIGDGAAGEDLVGSGQVAPGAPSAGWVRGARAAVGRGVSGVGASAVSVVTGVGGAAMSVATGIGGAVTGARAAESESEPMDGSDGAGAAVVDVRDDEIDLREDGEPSGPGEAAEDEAAEGEAAGDEAPGEVEPSDGGLVEDDPSGVEEGPVAAAPGADDDTAEIPVITVAGGPVAGSEDSSV